MLGAVLQVASITTTVILAISSSSTHPPGGATQALFVLIIAGTQIGSSFTFSGIGRADPTHARQSSKRLATLAAQVDRSRLRAEAAFEGDRSKADLHTEMGRLSAELSIFEDGLVGALEDWRVFHPSALPADEESHDGRR